MGGGVLLFRLLRAMYGLGWWRFIMLSFFGFVLLSAVAFKEIILFFSDFLYIFYYVFLLLLLLLLFCFIVWSVAFYCVVFFE